MPVCIHCRTDNAAGHRYCQKCGRPVADEEAANATVMWSGMPVRSSGPGRSLPATSLFEKTQSLLIGRSAEADICLAHPSVSRRHARLERDGAGIRVTDLGGINGVVVGGRRVQGTTSLTPGQRFGIGPFLLHFDAAGLNILDSSKQLRLIAREL